MARAGVYPAKPGSLSASIEALPPGAHEIWFVYAEDETVDPFLRVGKSLSVVLHAEHKKVKIDMKVPR